MDKQQLAFVKYSGNGNDFIILDHPQIRLTPQLVQRLCDRHFGIGADGVLSLTSVPGYAAEMRIFNASGSEAEMCGNGLRCLVTYLDEKAQVKLNKYQIKTMYNVYTVLRKDSTFAIEMSGIKDLGVFDLSVFKEFEKSFFVNSGVPHLVFLGKEIKSLNIKKIAPQYRYHSMFSAGTNVDLVEVVDAASQTAYVRTYERGIEHETYSCGTGLTASGLALAHWFGWKGDIHLQNLGGKQTVQIGENILFWGEVVRCFKGEFEI
jgi:diaminopimelate epimerase